MTKEGTEVRQSKKYVLFCCICASLCSVVSIYFATMALYHVVNDNYPIYSDHTTLGIYLFCFSLLVLFLFLAAEIYMIVIYKIQRDIFTTDKIIRKRGEKIIFELPYSNIITIKEGYFGLLAMELKSHIVLANGKKGTRNFFEHYSRLDIHRIKGMITEKYFNIPFN